MISLGWPEWLQGSLALCGKELVPGSRSGLLRAQEPVAPEVSIAWGDLSLVVQEGQEVETPAVYFCGSLRLQEPHTDGSSRCTGDSGPYDGTSSGLLEGERRKETELPIQLGLHSIH